MVVADGDDEGVLVGLGDIDVDVGVGEEEGLGGEGQVEGADDQSAVVE